MSVSKKIYLPIIISIVISIALIFSISYLNINSIKQDVIDSTVKNLKNIFFEKFEEKKRIGKAGAITIANDSVIKKALKEYDRTLAYKELKNLDTAFKKYTVYKHVKIHLHTKNLHSFIRVWKPEEYGDYLGNFRKSLVWVKKHKTPISTIEVGKSGLLLRGISPVILNNEYVGSVEFIQGLNSISNELRKRGVFVLVLMDEKYLNTAVFIKSNHKIGNYVISLNKDSYSKEFLREIKPEHLNKEKFFTDSYFIIKLPLYDFSKQKVGYALIGEKRDVINSVVNKSKAALVNQMLVILIIGMIMIFAFTKIISLTILKPLNKIKTGLKSFFEFLSDPDKKVEPIDIGSNDEFGEIASFINEGIHVSSNLHHELIELMQIIDDSVLILEFDEKMKIIGATDAFCNTSGYTKEEILEKFLCEIIAEYQRCKDVKRSIIDSEEFRGELRLLKKSSEEFIVYIMISKQKRNNKYVAIMYDITDKKKYQELSRHLEETVEKRTQEIQSLHIKTQQSIRFAALIQKSLLPENEQFEEFFDDHFIIWKPKDIVGGDIYLFEILNTKTESVLFVADCTGHGVPGAFLTMIVKSLQREVTSKIYENKELVISPAYILEYFNTTFSKLFKNDVRSGFDAGVFYYNKKDQIIQYAGANISLFYIEKDIVREIRGNKVSIGGRKKEVKFDEFSMEVSKGMRFYISTDGYFDQLGGSKGLPFGKKNFKKGLLLSNRFDMSEQKEYLERILEDYKNVSGYEQNDDITLIGVQIGDQIDYEEILYYEGVLTQSIITHIISILEDKIQNLKKLPKVSTVVIEMTQNMMLYAKNTDFKVQNNTAGEIKVYRIDGNYIIESKNLITKKDKEKIEKTLREITKLTKQQIKQKYRELRRSGEGTHRRGGGIGFYEIAKVVEKFEYEFREIKNNIYFKIKVVL